jgi:hypothetical protein
MIRKRKNKGEDEIRKKNYLLHRQIVFLEKNCVFFAETCFFRHRKRSFGRNKANNSSKQETRQHENEKNKQTGKTCSIKENDFALDAEAG